MPQATPCMAVLCPCQQTPSAHSHTATAAPLPADWLALPRGRTLQDIGFFWKLLSIKTLNPGSTPSPDTAVSWIWYKWHRCASSQGRHGPKRVVNSSLEPCPVCRVGGGSRKQIPRQQTAQLEEKTWGKKTESFDDQQLQWGQGWRSGVCSRTTIDRADFICTTTSEGTYPPATQRSWQGACTRSQEQLCSCTASFVRHIRQSISNCEVCGRRQSNKALIFLQWSISWQAFVNVPNQFLKISENKITQLNKKNIEMLLHDGRASKQASQNFSK